MKKQITITIFFFFFSFGKSFAQCDQPTAQHAIHGNNIKANILTGGDLFWDFADAKFQVPYENGNTPSTIFSAGLFMGGFSPGGSLKLSGSTYRNAANPGHYFPGPLTDIGTQFSTDDCQNFDRIWTVKGIEIQAHKNDFADNGMIDNPNPNIMGWPAIGNENFESIYGFELPESSGGYASFFDNVVAGGTNTIGVYEPELGDYPILPQAVSVDGIMIPSEMTWCVFNDRGSAFEAIRMEIQLTTFTFECSGDDILDNTLFTSYKMINKAVENIDSFYTSMWVDFDLGCYTDDQIGSSPERNTFFAYNQTNMDGPCTQGIPSYGENPPVQAVTILSKPHNYFIDPLNSDEPLSNFMVGSSSLPAGSFNTADETYNFISGSWADGTSLTQGGNGYNPGSTDVVKHHFPNDPNDSNGWSMETSNLPLTDYRVFGSTKQGRLLPGQILEWDLAWSYHRGEGNDRLENVTLMYDEVDQIQALYDSHFENACSITDVEQIDLEKSIQVFPNPTAGILNINFPNKKINNIRVVDAVGKLLLEDKVGKEISTTLDLTRFPQGIYFLQGEIENQPFSKKIVLIN